MEIKIQSTVIGAKPSKQECEQIIRDYKLEDILHDNN